MINCYRKIDGKLKEVDLSVKDIWINIINPTKKELEEIVDTTGVSLEFLEAPLDPEERPRIDYEEDETLIIINVPIEQEEGEHQIIYETVPLGMILTDDYFITVSLEKVDSINNFLMKPVKGVSPMKKTRFTLMIFYKTATFYLKYLKQIDRKTSEVERSLHRAMKNEQLIKMLNLEKSLVYFITSLKANEVVMKKVFRTNLIPMYEEDEDLLEDALTEVHQAIDMADINSNVIGGMMDAFASIISNNLNIVMKVLASVTIVMTIPTMVFSFFGMNVPIPGQSSPYAFIAVLIVTIVSTVWTFYLMKKKNFF